MMFSIEMDLLTVFENLFKIIQTADVDGIAIRTHSGPTEYVNPTGVTKVMARLF
jgi:hypothetical protein